MRWLVALALLVGTGLLVQPVRVALVSLLFLPAVFPNAPNPLAMVTPAPTRTEHHFTYAAGTVDADVYHPSGGGQHGAVLWLLGANALPRRDPLVVRFAESLARAGAVVMVPESSSLMAGRILPEEIDAIQQSFQLLSSQPDVDKERVGFIGFSIGGGLVLVAAAQPEIRDRVRFVTTLGGYYDAVEFFVDVASRSVENNGRDVPWEPSPLTRQVLAKQLIETLPDESDRAALTRAYLEGPSPSAVPSGLSPSATGVGMLLSGRLPRATVRAAVASLPPEILERLRAISPSSYVSDLRTRLFLMHDTGDTYIPHTQTRRLAATAPRGLIQRFTEFSIFQHVVPDRPVPWPVLVPEVWALYWHVHAVLVEVL